MVLLAFSYKILPYNINRIFKIDFNITNQNKDYKVENKYYDFKSQIRTIIYKCKNKNIQKLINNVKKIKIKNINWKILKNDI